MDWLRHVTGKPAMEYGEALELFTEGSDRRFNAAGLILYHFDKGKRKEQISRVVKSLRSGFKDAGFDPAIWEHYTVDAIRATCKRTLKEEREHEAGKFRMEKYPNHFELMWDLWNLCGMESIRWRNKRMKANF